MEPELIAGFGGAELLQHFDGKLEIYAAILAMHQHEGRTATWAGNSPDIVQRHYRGLITPTDAKAFWTIAPEPANTEKVRLPIQAAA